MRGEGRLSCKTFGHSGTGSATMLEDFMITYTYTHVCLYRSDVCLPVYGDIYDVKRFAWCLPSASCLTCESLERRAGSYILLYHCSLSSNDCPGDAGWEHWNKAALCYLAEPVIDEGYPWYSVPPCLLFKRPAGWVLTARSMWTQPHCACCAWALWFPFKLYFL